jgi:hypothetical protein
MDLAHNGRFDTYLTEQNDLPIVQGRDAFEQEIVNRLTDYTESLIGTVERRGTILRMITLQAYRVADDTDEIESLATINARYSEDEHNVVLLDLIYATGDGVTFPITLS